MDEDEEVVGVVLQSGLVAGVRPVLGDVSVVALDVLVLLQSGLVAGIRHVLGDVDVDVVDDNRVAGIVQGCGAVVDEDERVAVEQLKVLRGEGGLAPAGQVLRANVDVDVVDDNEGGVAPAGHHRRARAAEAVPGSRKLCSRLAAIRSAGMCSRSPSRFHATMVRGTARRFVSVDGYMWGASD